MTLRPDDQNLDTSRWAEPPQYNRFIGGIELKAVSMTRGEFSAPSFDTSAPPVESKITFDARFALRDGGFVAFHTLELKGSPSDQKQPLVRILGEFAVTYDSEVPLDESLFLPFMHLNLPVHTWPYFREFVQACLSRLDWPRLSLPVFTLVEQR